MEIAEIKAKLLIGQVLAHYGLQPNKNKMLNCPFHDDKNPSMQVYPETNTVHCFSGNCEHTGKAIDQMILSCTWKSVPNMKPSKKPNPYLEL